MQRKDSVLHYLDLLPQPNYWHDGVTRIAAGMEGRMIKGFALIFMSLEIDCDKAYI